MRHPLDTRALAAMVAVLLATGCTDSPTAPTTASSVGTAPQDVHVLPTDVPTGERLVGNGHAAIEPAYDADSGEIMYLLTPVGAPLPSHANSHAVSPLYLVEYPPGSTAAAGGHFNCEGVPGNCPDHAGDVAGVAVGAQPTVYGTNAAAVPGHDHIADPPGKPDFNIAWEVVEVVFTPQAVTDDAINTRLTTDSEIEAAVAAGDVVEIDLGFAFNCNVVSPAVYWAGTPVGA